jgi:RHS repeat-associated protein
MSIRGLSAAFSLVCAALVLSGSASARSDAGSRAAGCPLPDCTITFTIQAVPSAGDPTTSNPPTIGGPATWKVTMSPNYLGDNCSQASVAAQITGANPQSLSWTAASMPPGGVFMNYQGTNVGADQIYFTASVAGCNASTYDIAYSGGRGYSIGWGVDLWSNGQCDDPWAPTLRANPVFRMEYRQQCVDDPVSTASGKYMTAVVDARLAAPGLPFSFARSYSSGDTRSGDLGYGWHDQFDAYLAQINASTVYVYLGTGQRLTFTKSGANWVGSANVAATLQSVFGGYVLTFPDDQSLTFNLQFGGGGQLTGVVDHGQALAVVSYGYGIPGQVTTTNGKHINFTYDTSNRITKLTLPDGRYVQYAYDASGNLATVTDLRGGTTHYTYDGYHRLLTVVDPRGHTLVTNTYDVWNNLATQTDAVGNTTTFKSDAGVGVGAAPSGGDYTAISQVDDARGKNWKGTLVNGAAQGATRAPDGSAAENTASAQTGDTASYKDPLGNTVSFTYDTSRNLTQVSLPGGITFSKTYNTSGDPLTATDGNGHTTSYSYDGNGNPTLITQPGGATVGMTYNGHGQVTTVTDEAGKTMSYGHDTDGNLTSVTTPLGKKTTFGYDSAGRVTSIVDPRGNITGANPADYTTTVSYDAADEITAVTDALGHTTSYSYDADGNLASLTDANNHVTSYTYDNANRLTTVTAPDLSTTSYGYDAVGNITSRTDGNGHTTIYAYDDDNRLHTITDALSRTWTLGYDAASNLTSIQTPSGGTISYSYDALGRRSGASYSDSTPAVGYGYDADGNRTSLSDGAGSAAAVYNALDELTSVTRGTGAFSYTYDADGRIATRTYPDGTTTNYTYNDDGQLTSASQGSATTGYQYDAAGHLTQTTLPNSVVETAAYNRVGWLTSRNDGFRSFVYGYDPAGNLTSRTVGGATTSYTYDALNRLTGISGPTTISYGYDNVGNRTSQSTAAGTTSYSYDAADELTSTSGPGGTTSYGYDANGNQTSAGGWTFAVNLAGQITSASDGTTTTQYAYDGDGNRLAATTAGVATNYLWDSNFRLPQLALEQDGTGSLLRRYGYGLDRTSFTTPSTVAYYSSDALGSVTELSSTTGVQLGQYDSLPFGDTATSSNVDPSVASNPFAFTGEYLDPATGLYDLRARQYDPTSGRFTSPDPLGPQAAGTYVYSGDNPLTQIDPSGLRHTPSCSLLCHIGGLTVGCAANTYCNTALWTASLLTDQPEIALEADAGLVAAEEGGALSGAFRGGLYKDLDAPEGIERHHMIADSISPLPRGEGPSIQMEVAEHRMTGSWGNSAAARAYRAQQAAMVAEGDTAGAPPDGYRQRPDAVW